MAVIGPDRLVVGLLCVPVAVLIGFAFAGAGLGATTLHAVVHRLRLREPGDHPDVPVLGHVLPAQRSTPSGLQWVVRCTPLYQGVALERALVFGDIGPELLVNVAYLVVMGSVGLWVAGRRLGTPPPPLRARDTRSMAEIEITSSRVAEVGGLALRRSFPQRARRTIGRLVLRRPLRAGDHDRRALDVDRASSPHRPAHRDLVVRRARCSTPTASAPSSSSDRASST